MSGKGLWLSKVLVKFQGECGYALGEQTVFVVSGKAAKDKVAAAMEKTKDHDLLDERVHAIRTCQIIAEADCHGKGFAETLQEWNLGDDALDETVHEIASLNAAAANNAGVAEQIKFIGMDEGLAEQIVGILNANDGQ
jgi:hypothetical protein